MDLYTQSRRNDGRKQPPTLPINQVTEIINPLHVLLSQGHPLLCPSDQISWLPCFSKVHLNFSSGVYFTLFTVTTLVFRICIWISFQMFIQLYFLLLFLFSKCTPVLLFNIIIRPLKFIYLIDLEWGGIPHTSSNGWSRVFMVLTGKLMTEIIPSTKPSLWRLCF